MPVEALPKDNGEHTATLSTFKMVRVVHGVGRWKAVVEGRKGTAEGRGCLSDGNAGAKTMGLESQSFSCEDRADTSVWQMRLLPMNFQ